MSLLRNMIDSEERLSVRAQCELLDINRSGLYYNTVGETSENLKIMRLLDAHFMEHPTYGVLQMKDYLRDEGFLY